MTDWNLVEGYVRNGEDDAFRELVNRYLNLVYSSALRITQGDRALAEEIAQKTFCVLAQKASALRPSVVIAGWLYRTALNVGREMMRAERRRRFYERQASSMDDPNTPSELKERFESLVDTALATLAELDRTSILLRFFQNKSMREVGECLGISEDAAKMRVSRALEKLRQRLGKLGLVVPAAGLAALLSETISNAAPALTQTVVNRALQTVSARKGLSLLGRIFLMSTTQKVGIVGVLFLLSALVTSRLQRSTNHSLTPGPRSAVTQRTTPARSAARRTAPLDDAIFNLRAALLDPIESRKIPFERVDKALTAFSGNESAAVAILFEVLNMPRKERPFLAFILAGHGLEVLGPKAASAIPDVLRLLREGDLAVLNSNVPKLINALSPDGAVVPALIEMLKTPELIGADWVGSAINAMIEANPSLEISSFRSLHLLLDDPDPSVQRNAACTLAGLPTQKDPAVLPILIGALNLEKLRDPKAYEPLVIPSQSMTIQREDERFADDIWRSQAIQALKEFGPGAKDAVPALLEVAERSAETNTFELRRYALMAVSTIQPDFEDDEVAGELVQSKRALDLAEKAKGGSATFDELVEGLRDSRSVSFAAERLRDSPENARKASTELLAAIDQFADYDAIQTVKQIDPALLVERLKNRNWKGLSEVAQALGELGPTVAYSIPYLENAFAEISVRDSGTISAIGEALQKISPGYPKPIFGWDDLHEAAGALVQEIYRTGKTDSPVYQAYIRDFQDQNNVPRPQLIRFIEATKADPELHRLFMQKLLEKNPSLPVELKNTLSTN